MGRWIGFAFVKDGLQDDRALFLLFSNHYIHTNAVGSSWPEWSYHLTLNPVAGNVGTVCLKGQGA